MNVCIIHHFFLKSNLSSGNTWKKNDLKLHEDFLTYYLNQAKIRIPCTPCGKSIQEPLISRQKNEDSSGASAINQIMSQSDDITASLNAFLTSIATNPDNIPVNDEEPILKPLPVGTHVKKPNLMSPSEKNPLSGQYIFTNSLLIKRAPSVLTSVKSDLPGSTSNKIQKETLVPTNN